jgi:hypothetical protein
MFGISEVASIDEEVTILTKALMKDVMIAVLERVVDALGEINDALRMAFHKTLKGLKTPAGHIFLSPWFVIGTMPFADKFNGCGMLVVHFRRAVWKKSIILPLRKDRPCFQEINCYKKKNQTCDCESGSVWHFETSRNSYIYTALFWTFVPCESSWPFPPFLKVLLLSKQRCRKIRLKPMIRYNNTGPIIVKTYKGLMFDGFVKSRFYSLREHFRGT